MIEKKRVSQNKSLPVEEFRFIELVYFLFNKNHFLICSK
jgi:hypothetical protein